MGGIMSIPLYVGSRHGCLPSMSTRSRSFVLLVQLLTFKTPSREFRVLSRNEALCDQGKTGRTGAQTVRYF